MVLRQRSLVKATIVCQWPVDPLMGSRKGLTTCLLTDRGENIINLGILHSSSNSDRIVVKVQVNRVEIGQVDVYSVLDLVESQLDSMSASCCQKGYVVGSCNRNLTLYFHERVKTILLDSLS
jgi:hypothetical protein